MAQTADQIASVLRERINSGELQPGDRLPTMDALADQYGVNRQTARNALNILKNEGLVEYGGGRSGTTVRRRPTERMIRSRGMERDEMGYYSGPDVAHWKSVRPTAVSQEPVPADIARLLGVAPGTIVITRKRLIGDPDVPELRQLADTYLHPAAVEAVPIIAAKDTGLGGMYDRIEEWARRPVDWWEDVMAATPSPAETADLLLPPGVSLLRVLRTSAVTIDSSVLAFEIQDIRMSGERFSVRYPLDRVGAARWPVEPATRSFYS